MSFFDQKQEVLDIELTPYGRGLLSRGKWKPVYYAFFDDDIIYEPKYSGVNETNAESVERIKTSPRLKSQYVFTGVEEQVEKQIEAIKQNKQMLESLLQTPKADKHFYSYGRLGNSILGDKNSPAFKINALNGEINSTNIFQIGDKQSIRVPLIEIKDVEYKLKSIKLEADQQNINPFFIPLQFSDGTAVEIMEDFLLLEFNESNVEDQSKNFEIEMFLVETNQTTGEESYQPVYFDQKFENFKNGILLDPQILSSEDQIYFNDQKLLNNFRAENYFDILIDNEIDKNLICKLLNKVHNGNANQYMENYDCEEALVMAGEEAAATNTAELYNSSLSEDEIKKC